MRRRIRYCEESKSKRRGRYQYSEKRKDEIWVKRSKRKVRKTVRNYVESNMKEGKRNMGKE